MHELDLVSSASSVLPVITGLYFYKRQHGILKILVVFFIFSCLTELLLYYLSSRAINNLWFVNIFFLIEYMVFSFVCAQFSGLKMIIRLSILFALLYTVAWVFTTFYIFNIYRFNNLIRTVESILLIFFSGVALYQISMDVSVNLFKNPKFWFSAGILIYFSTNLIVFSIADMILDNRNPIIGNAWAIHSFWNIVTCFIFATGFVWNSTKQTHL